MTSTDENEDEENMNTQSWTESSIDDNDPMDKQTVKPLLAVGPSVPNIGKSVEG